MAERRDFDPQHHPYTLSLCTANVLNLALPGRVYYENKEPYSKRYYEQKVKWLGDFIHLLNPDVMAVQEVWDKQALEEVVKRSGLDNMQVIAPVAENKPAGAGRFIGGAKETPAVAFITRLEVLKVRSYVDMPAACAVELPELGRLETFSRPPLHVELQSDKGFRFHVITVHLKSKRPKFLRGDDDEPLEDVDDPRIRARAKMRSLCMRAAEAAALRHIIVDHLEGTHDPMVVMGDLNDSSHSVTTQLLADTSEVAYDRSARDTALFNAYENQTRQALRRDVAYSHIYQGYPEVLDQVFVSEEFLRHSKFSCGRVLRVDYFNDHLKLPRDRSFSDHGFVKAVLRIEGRRA